MIDEFKSRRGRFQNRLDFHLPKLDQALNTIINLRDDQGYNAGDAPKALLAKELAERGKRIQHALQQIQQDRTEDEEEEL